MYQKLRTKFQKRRGSTLLLSLLVLATVLAIAVSVTDLARVEIIASRANDYTIVSAYAAETALEEAAYLIRKNESMTVSALAGSGTLANDAAWSRTALGAESSLIIPSLAKDQAHGFSLYDPDSGLAGNKESVLITVAGCTGSEWLELGLTEWTPGSGFGDNFQKFRYNCSAGVPIVNNQPAASKAYRMYVRYIEGPAAAIGPVSITGCSVDNGLGSCDMAGRVSISAVGSFRNASRTMGLTMPRAASVSGIFGYAVFSECQIIKDPTAAPSCH